MHLCHRGREDCAWNGAPASLAQLPFCARLLRTDAHRPSWWQLRGDLALGITVHYTRLLMWFVTLPHAEVSPFVVKLILVAWSATEVARYPMVLFPSSAGLKTFRYLVPLVTFPLGAGTEAFAAYTVAQVRSRPRVARRACSAPVPASSAPLTTRTTSGDNCASRWWHTALRRAGACGARQRHRRRRVVPEHDSQGDALALAQGAQRAQESVDFILFTLFR